MPFFLPWSDGMKTCRYKAKGAGIDAGFFIRVDFGDVLPETLVQLLFPLFLT